MAQCRGSGAEVAGLQDGGESVVVILGDDGGGNRCGVDGLR